MRSAAERLVGHIDVDPACQCEGDHQRRRHQKVRADRLVHARLEVAIAGKDADADEVVARNGLLDARIERAGIAYAGRASVADGVEAKLVEVGLQSAALVVVGDDARARRKRRLDDARHAQTFLHRLLREQTGGKHHGWIGCVGAGGDRSDENIAVMQLRHGCRKLVSLRIGRDAVGRWTVVEHLLFAHNTRVLLRGRQRVGGRSRVLFAAAGDRAAG